MSMTKTNSIKEFCKRIGISKATFYRHQDDMPHTVRIGAQRRILEKDEKAWLEKLSTWK